MRHKFTITLRFDNPQYCISNGEALQLIINITGKLTNNIEILYNNGEINHLIMTSLVLKVDEKIPQEIDLIKEMEGLGNRTATITFLIKYYFLTQKSSLEQSIGVLNTLIDRTDTSNIPSPEEQLKDI